MADEMSELAEPASLEERITAKFDESPTDDTELTAEETEELSPPDSEVSDEFQEAFEEIEYNGKPYRVPADLKDGFMSKQDYTRKTQELAKSRQAIEALQNQFQLMAQHQQFDQSIQPEREEIGTLNYQLKLYQDLDWSSMETGDMLKLKMQMENIERQRNELQQGLERKRQNFLQTLQAQRKEFESRIPELVKGRINTWNEQSAADLSSYALSKGFTEFEVNNMLNPRDIEVLWKAQQYDRLLESKHSALKKAQKAPPVIKPGAVSPLPSDQRDQLNYRKALKQSRDRGDAPGQTAKIIEQRLAKRFGGK